MFDLDQGREGGKMPPLEAGGRGKNVDTQGEEGEPRHSGSNEFYY